MAFVCEFVNFYAGCDYNEDIAPHPQEDFLEFFKGNLIKSIPLLSIVRDKENEAATDTRGRVRLNTNEVDLENVDLIAYKPKGFSRVYWGVVEYFEIISTNVALVTFSLDSYLSYGAGLEGCEGYWSRFPAKTLDEFALPNLTDYDYGEGEKISPPMTQFFYGLLSDFLADFTDYTTDWKYYIFASTDDKNDPTKSVKVNYNWGVPFIGYEIKANSADETKQWLMNYGSNFGLWGRSVSPLAQRTVAIKCAPLGLGINEGISRTEGTIKVKVSGLKYVKELSPQFFKVHLRSKTKGEELILDVSSASNIYKEGADITLEWEVESIWVGGTTPRHLIRTKSPNFKGGLDYCYRQLAGDTECPDMPYALYQQEKLTALGTEQAIIGGVLEAVKTSASIGLEAKNPQAAAWGGALALTNSTSDLVDKLHGFGGGQTAHSAEAEPWFCFAANAYGFEIYVEKPIRGAQVTLQDYLEQIGENVSSSQPILDKEGYYQLTGNVHINKKMTYRARTEIIGRLKKGIYFKRSKK